MKTVRILSKILFYLTRVLAFVYLAIFLHSFLALTTGWCLKILENGQIFAVCYPFTNKNFLRGENHLSYIIIDFLMILFLIALFCWLIGNVFRLFFQPKLFTENGVKHLKIFYLANFILPTVAYILGNMYTDLDNLSLFFVFIHFLIGVFAFFFSVIFKQGVLLQNNQDLYI